MRRGLALPAGRTGDGLHRRFAARNVGDPGRWRGSITWRRLSGVTGKQRTALLGGGDGDAGSGSAVPDPAVEVLIALPAGRVASERSFTRGGVRLARCSRRPPFAEFAPSGRTVPCRGRELVGLLVGSIEFAEVDDVVFGGDRPLIEIDLAPAPDAPEDAHAFPPYLTLRFPSRTRTALILAQNVVIRVSFFRSFHFSRGLVARAKSILPGRMAERGGCRRRAFDASVDGPQVGE